MKTIKISLAVIALLLATASSYAKLEIEPRVTKPNNEMERVKDLGQGLLGESKEQKCEKINSRISNRITAFNANKEAKEQVYANIKERVSTIIARLKEKGYDTSLLEDDLIVLSEKIVQYWNDRQAVITTLEDAKNYPCGESNGVYKQKIQEARDLMKVVLADARDIRTFITTIIRGDIQGVRAQEPNTPTTLEVED